MTNKTYILLKDLPGCPAGTESEFHSGAETYKFAGEKNHYFTEKEVEGNPDWFHPPDPLIYTESDLKKAAQDAFVAAREEETVYNLGAGAIGNYPKTLKYKTFQDYLNSKQK